ncbi:hypothetical protein [Propionivibrio sp.]|uniref:hypothetical protein n=1 Tax=Propionivibrio sp. TaxID=2212460 RepID=UPI003BF0828C
MKKITDAEAQQNGKDGLTITERGVLSPTPRNLSVTVRGLFSKLSEASETFQ